MSGRGKTVIITVAALFAAVGLVGVCAGFLNWGGFVHDERLVGPYRLIAVDIDEQMSVARDFPGGGGSAIGRITETVFAVGWNDRYLVAKQHPIGQRSVTNYFYLDMTRDRDTAGSDAVTGPLSESEFLAAKTKLGLPDFTRVIDSLQ